MIKRTTIAAAILLAGQLVLSACASGTATTTASGTTAAGTTAAGTTAAGTTTAGTTGEVTKVKIGLVGARHEMWDQVKLDLVKENIDLELVEFTDYNTPNQALVDGSLDVNAFQHYIFLDNYNATKGTDLVSIGDTFLSPIGIYSDKYASVEEIQDGDAISIPDDTTNSGRALRALHAAGVIVLKDPSNFSPTQADIAENPKNLTINELDASMVARTLQDVGAAVINTNMAVDAGLVPADDAIFLEPVDENSKPYYNLIAVRAEDKDNPIYKKIVEAYQTQAIGDLMVEIYRGAQFPVWEGYQSK